MMRVTIFDYGAGNLHSLAKALQGPNRKVLLARDPIAAIDTDLLVLPGVGAFATAAAALAPGRELMRNALLGGLPCLGICLGMQLLFGKSEEGPGQGLSVIAGTVSRLRATRLPQMGWNEIEASEDSLFDECRLRTAYYANSFVCRPESPESIIAWSTHEQDRFPAAVRVRRTLGVQFHPEKSSAPGVALIQQFIASVRP